LLCFEINAGIDYHPMVIAQMHYDTFAIAWAKQSNLNLIGA